MSESERDKELASAVNPAMQAKVLVRLYKRISDPKKENITNFLANLSQTNLPFHVNMAISRHLTPGQSNPYLDRVLLRQLKVVRHNHVASTRDLKAAMWSLAFLCANERGFEYLADINKQHRVFANLFDFVCYLVSIAESHPRLTMRATGFYCLNLVSKSNTGANLVGKLGWHTFKTNRLKASEDFLFLSSLATDTTTTQTIDDFSSAAATSEFYNYDLSFDFFVAFYNLMRAKASLGLRELRKYGSAASLSKFELGFLSERNTVNLLTEPDSAFLKPTARGIYLESLCIPMRATLICIDGMLSTSSLIKTDLAVDDLKIGCSIEKCFYCLLLAKHWIQLDENDNEDSGDDKATLAGGLETRAKILTALRLLFMTVHPDLEKLFLRRFTSELRKPHSAEFNFCLMILVYERYLSCLKIKFHWRKYLQEMFVNVLPIHTKISIT
jgi:hypothetical protein